MYIETAGSLIDLEFLFAATGVDRRLNRCPVCRNDIRIGCQYQHVALVTSLHMYASDILIPLDAREEKSNRSQNAKNK